MSAGVGTPAAVRAADVRGASARLPRRLGPGPKGHARRGRCRAALATPGLTAVAEVKRRSPSAGDLRPDADPAALAAAFEQVGAAAVSILVDERFAGSPADLAAARSAAGVPLLAKGFFSAREELEELRGLGADA